MVQLPNDLQKQNFYDALLKMHSVPGWEVFEEGGLLALKSPARLPFVNMVWGEASPENTKKMRSFFAQQSFSWYLTQAQSDAHLLQSGFKEPEPAPEMVLNLNTYAFIQPSPEISIIRVTSDNDFYLWSKIASETFQCQPEVIIEFFQPLIKLAGDIPYLAFYENEPAATSLLFYDNQIAGIYAMSTREKFRRKGLGWAVAQACIQTANDIGIPYAVVYASKQGKLLYEKMGFKTVQILREYFFEPPNIG